ncbi:hypothetical protein L218DRAFT_754431 [Marasmius fiardii PR-910]|nr:hypothetical protein L218DRAFT_754431 [Marasmius fiardii PR-910]
MNTGVQDSFTLAWKIALIHRGLSPYSLLMTYDEERIPVIEHVLNQTTSLLNKNLRGQAKPSSWRRDGNLFQLGINCRWSSIIVDQSRDDGQLRETGSRTGNSIDPYGGDGDQTLRAGDRAPDAAGLRLVHATFHTKKGGYLKCRLFDVLDVASHTLFLFNSDSDRLASILEVLSDYPKGVVRMAMVIRDGEPVVLGDKQPDFILEDGEEHAYTTYDLENGCDIAIVRPDGIIGAIVKDRGGLREYLGRLFVH